MPGPQELLVIAVVALLVFGPDRLPEVMRSAGRLLARFREQSEKSISELREAAEFDEVNRELRGLRHEVQETTSSMSQQVRSTASSVRDAASGAVDGAGPAGGSEDLAPPPMDPEAT